MNDTGSISDGYHTFDELYYHRHLLFIALMRANPKISWVSRKHSDGTQWDGWFIAGMQLPTGDITYHLPAHLWPMAVSTGVEVLDKGKIWDGHSSDDVIRRLEDWLFM